MTPRARFDRHAERHDVLSLDLDHLSLIARDGDVRIRPGVAVPGKVLADGAHAGVGEALHDARAQRADRGGVEMQRAVADHRASRRSRGRAPARS
jgi:hypothetical protein